LIDASTIDCFSARHWLECVKESTGFGLIGRKLAMTPVLVFCRSFLSVVIGDVCLNESREFAIDSFEGGAASVSCWFWEGAGAAELKFACDDDEIAASPSFMHANSFGSVPTCGGCFIGGVKFACDDDEIVASPSFMHANSFGSVPTCGGCFILGASIMTGFETLEGEQCGRCSATADATAADGAAADCRDRAGMIEDSFGSQPS